MKRALLSLLVVGVLVASCDDDDTSNNNENNTVNNTTNNHNCDLAQGACDNEGDMQCSSDRGAIEHCVIDAHGCLVWEVSDACPEAQSCSAEGEPECLCDNDCTVGETQCLENVLETCTENDAGCTLWVETQDCALTELACEVDQGVAACVDPNPPVCQEGETRCSGDILEYCDVSGAAPQWAEQADCALTAEFCNDDLAPAACATCTPESGCIAGKSCSYTDQEYFACTEEGTGIEGSSCEVQGCGPGLICDGYGDTGAVCVVPCDEASDCAGDSTHCVWWWQDASLDWGQCMEGCDPVLQTGCAATEGCYYGDFEFGDTFCWAEGSLSIGADCSDFSEMCEAGSDCVPDSVGTMPTYFCRAYCDDDSQCDPNHSCTFTGHPSALKYCLPN